MIKEEGRRESGREGEGKGKVDRGGREREGGRKRERVYGKEEKAPYLTSRKLLRTKMSKIGNRPVVPLPNLSRSYFFRQ